MSGFIACVSASYDLDSSAGARLISAAMTTLLFEHASYGRHEVPPGHVEHPGRYQSVARALADPQFDDIERRAPALGSREAIARVHAPDFIDAVFAAAPTKGLAQLDADTFMGPTSLEASLRAVGAGLAAVEAVMAGEADNAFIAARPPGHHAEPDRAMGFCFFNHAAIAAHHARSLGATRIAVVDFDVHHGNGTQTAFWHDEDAFFASSHEWPQYPGTGRESDRGAFDTIANAPLATGSDGDAFRRAWGEKLLPRLDDFDPDFIVISAGFDAHARDPLGGLKLTEDDFAWVTGEILAIARARAGRRVVSLLEGGYDLAALGLSARAHLAALRDKAI